jgi:hypothetical protein
MRYIDETDDLLEQLDEALDELESGEDVALEVAMLGGTLARRGLDSPILVRAAAWRDRASTADLDLRPAFMDVLESLFSEDEPDLDAEDLLGDLIDLDEVAAAATWLGFAGIASEAVGRALRLFERIPPVAREFAPMAEEVLAEAPPSASDPIGELWRAIRNTRKSPTRERPRRA